MLTFIGIKNVLPFKFPIFNTFTTYRLGKMTTGFSPPVFEKIFDNISNLSYPSSGHGLTWTEHGLNIIACIYCHKDRSIQLVMLVRIKT